MTLPFQNTSINSSGFVIFEDPYNASNEVSGRTMDEESARLQTIDSVKIFSNNYEQETAELLTT